PRSAPAGADGGGAIGLEDERDSVAGGAPAYSEIEGDDERIDRNERRIEECSGVAFGRAQYRAPGRYVINGRAVEQPALGERRHRGRDHRAALPAVARASARAAVRRVRPEVHLAPGL